jgi:hypothetical protein
MEIRTGADIEQMRFPDPTHCPPSLLPPEQYVSTDNRVRYLVKQSLLPTLR